MAANLAELWNYSPPINLYTHMKKILFLLLLAVVGACFFKIAVLNIAQGEITKSELVVSRMKLQQVQNVILYEESKEFDLDYEAIKGYEIPYLSDYMNTLTVKAHGIVTLYYGVTIDSFSYDGMKVYYKPYCQPPALALHNDVIDQTTFGEYTPEDSEKIQNMAYDLAPQPDFGKVCDRFEAITDSLSHGSVLAIRGRLKN